MSTEATATLDGADDPFGRRPIYTTLAHVEPELISWLWSGWIHLENSLCSTAIRG